MPVLGHTRKTSGERYDPADEIEFWFNRSINRLIHENIIKHLKEVGEKTIKEQMELQPAHINPIGFYGDTFTTQTADICQ